LFLFIISLSTFGYTLVTSHRSIAEQR